MPLLTFSRLAVVVTLLYGCANSTNAAELFPKELTSFSPVAGNPALSAFELTAFRNLLKDKYLRKAVVLCPSHWDKNWDKSVQLLLTARCRRHLRVQGNRLRTTHCRPQQS